MNTSGPSSSAVELPFPVPCPPPALRVPPPVFRMPPAVQRKDSKPVPLPPKGARTPGDRSVWKPRISPKAIVETAHSPALERELAEIVPEFESAYLSLDNEGGESIPDSDHEKGQSSGVNEDVTAVFEPRRKIYLRDNSIQICALADLLGIKAYEVLRHLITLGIFAKSTDSIDADTVQAISSVYGCEIVCDGSTLGEESIDEKASGPDFHKRTTFELKPNLNVTAGDWIRDSVLGLGRILTLHTHRDEHDRHRVWFIGQSEEGTIIEQHPLLPSTLGVIDKSMVPKDIFDVAPEIDP